jgi:outer membrane biosynthesis protein TonB
MKYLNTKHERNSAKITALLMLILLLLIFVVGPPYLDPPPEYGVAVNFGNTNYGSGNVQPDKPVKSENLQINKPPQENQAKEDSQPEQTPAKTVADDVLTQETEAAIAIKKKKEAAAKAKLEADKKAKKKAEAEAKKQKEEAEKKKKLDELMGGLNNSDGEASGSEGDDDKAGDKGQLNGNPYAPSYFGAPGTGSGGVGYGLNGRGKPSKTKVIPKCQEEGRVVVEIQVNQSGKVIKATPGVKGTTGDSCLFDAAKKTALSHRWRADSKAPTRQVGFVVVDFSVGN